MLKNVFTIQIKYLPEWISPNFEGVFKKIEHSVPHSRQEIAQSIIDHDIYTYVSEDLDIVVRRYSTEKEFDFSKPVYLATDQEFNLDDFYTGLEDIYRDYRKSHQLGSLEDFIAEAKRLPTSLEVMIEQINWTDYCGYISKPHKTDDNPLMVFLMHPVE